MDIPLRIIIQQVNDLQSTHDRWAPYWASALFLLVITGLSTTWFKWGSFWNGYVLDITGPAWNYILFRNLFTQYRKNWWTDFFSPLKTLSIFILILYGIELLQYFKVYDSTYDPWDLLAYISLLVPFFIIDLYLTNKSGKAEY